MLPHGSSNMLLRLRMQFFVNVLPPRRLFGALRPDATRRIFALFYLLAVLKGDVKGQDENLACLLGPGLSGRTGVS